MFVLIFFLQIALNTSVASTANEKLSQAIKPFLNNEINAFIVAQDGQKIYQYYSPSFDEKKRHRSWSMAKTFMVILAGIMEKDNIINREDSIGECVGIEKFNKIKLKHLMQMTSGIEFIEKYESNPLTSHVVEMLFMSNGFKDMAGYMLQQNVIHSPGEVFNYSSGDSILLMHCLQRKLTLPLKQYFDAKLFGPLDMTSVFLEYDQQGLWVSASYLYANANDYLKFGEFMRSPHEKIIDPEYIAWMNDINIASPHPKHDLKKPYGAGVWVFQADEKLNLQVLSKHPDLQNAFMARGHNGQAIVVVPKHKLVIVKLAYESAKDDYLPSLIEAIIEKGLTP
jgi:CubicO group peptidase (beta-lactamase class C family)